MKKLILITLLFLVSCLSYDKNSNDKDSHDDNSQHTTSTEKCFECFIGDSEDVCDCLIANGCAPVDLSTSVRAVAILAQCEQDIPIDPIDPIDPIVVDEDTSLTDGAI